MFANSILLVLLGLGVGIQAQGVPTTCAAAPNMTVNYTILQAYSPWYVMRSSDPSYNCTTGILTGPAPEDGTTYTWLFVQNDTIKNIADLSTSDNISIKFKTCKGGIEYDYHFLALTPDYWIVYICEPSQQNIWALRGYGHTDADAQKIDEILAQYKFTFTNNATVQNMQTGCTDSPYCNGFYM